jgi:FAD/FMN-containing dehydrogenase
MLAAAENLSAPLREALLKLNEKIQGQVLLAPSEAGGEAEAYHTQRERPFFYQDCNYPSVIVLVETVQDVADTMKFISSEPAMDSAKMPLCLAGGCHSHYCMVDKSMVIDLHKLKAVMVDKEAKTITIAGGAKILDAHKALEDTGLGFATGTNSDTGVSGLTMAGGAGYLGGQAGFACDTVTAAKVVLLSGELVEATDDNEYKDLLRALRGGGGNFGIVVEWTFKLFDVSNAFGGQIVYMAPTVNTANQVLKNYAKIITDKNCPDQAGAICALPAGAPVVAVVATMIGDEVRDAKTYKDVPYLTQISSLGGAWFRIANDVARKDYIREISVQLEPVQQRCFAFVVGAMVYALDDAITEALIHFSRVDAPKGNTAGTILIMSLHGEMRRGDGSKNSLRHRQAVAWVIVEGSWKPNATDRQIQSVKDWAKRAKDKIIELGGEDGPHTFGDTDGKRIKFFNEEQRSFLESAKKKYDPNNLLSLNKNISAIGHAD